MHGNASDRQTRPAPVVLEPGHTFPLRRPPDLIPFRKSGRRRALVRPALHLPRLHKTDEMLKGSIIGRLGGCRETAAGQLPHLQVIGDALAAGPFPRTGFI